jgi:Leucine-rich repeat (LRR) protein
MIKHYENLWPTTRRHGALLPRVVIGSKAFFYHVTDPGRNLGGLAFLDLAQNHIQEVRRADLTGLTSLTALNLERNVIQQLDEDTFAEVNRSLSSVSLLNNLLTKYPEGALTSLKDLRVSAAIDRFLHLVSKNI